MADRRPKGMSVHDWQHQLIEERRAAWRGSSKAKGADRLRRRELHKKYVWTLIGHLRQCHLERGSQMNLATSTSYDLESFHMGFHDDDY